MGNRKDLVSFVRAWCTDDSHGYSQVNRWGPDCDCSSLMYMAASEAGYDIPREGTRYTGTMCAHFSQAGFAVLPFKGDFQRYPAGSIYLSDKGHTEMDLGDCLGGARIDECGGIAGAVPGDQSGGEVSICAKYDYPWDWVLVPADCVPGGLKNPRYRVKTKEHGWLPWMEGLKSLDGSLDDFAGASGVPAVGFDIDWNAGLVGSDSGPLIIPKVLTKVIREMGRPYARLRFITIRKIPMKQGGLRRNIACQPLAAIILNGNTTTRIYTPAMGNLPLTGFSLFLSNRSSSV